MESTPAADQRGQRILAEYVHRDADALVRVRVRPRLRERRRAIPAQDHR